MSGVVRVNVEVPLDLMDALADAAQKYPGIYNTAIRRNTSRLMSRMLDELRDEPGSPKYPLRWASERQRRAYFATNGFGRGIPYKRTGKLAKSWEADIILTDGSGDFVIGNSDPSSIYVQGDLQQPFHIDTGWPAAAPIISRYADLLESVLIDTWYVVTDAT